VNIKPNHFVPVLKWKMAEYQSLFRLADSVKDMLVPLIVVPPRGYDFEKKQVAKTVQEHIEGIPQKLTVKWGSRPALIDIHPSLEDEVMNTGESVITYIFNKLSDNKVTPVTGVSRSETYQSHIKDIIANSSTGVAVSIGFDELVDPNLNKNIEKVALILQVQKGQIDLIIDLENPGAYTPYTEFAEALIHSMHSINEIDKYRSFVLIGTSLKLGQISKPGASVDRHEWILYQQLITQLHTEDRIPTFGDYTIEQAGFPEEMDMRLVNPAGKIVYSSDDTWYVPKGGSFRNNPAQMVQHCKSIVHSGHFRGSQYSFGDKRIEETSTLAQGTGNLTTWKTVGINHHITLMVELLSNFHGA
jgi:hypothetical protein